MMNFWGNYTFKSRILGKSSVEKAVLKAFLYAGLFLATSTIRSNSWVQLLSNFNYYCRSKHFDNEKL